MEPTAYRIPRVCPVCDHSPLRAEPYSTDLFEEDPEAEGGGRAVAVYNLVEVVGTAFECDRCYTCVIAGGLRRVEESEQQEAALSA